MIFDSAIESLSAELDVWKQKYGDVSPTCRFHSDYIGGFVPPSVWSTFRKACSDIIMTDSAGPHVKRWWNDLVLRPCWVEASKGLIVEIVESPQLWHVQSSGDLRVVKAINH